MFGMGATRIALSMEWLKVGGVGAVGMRDSSTPARVITLRRSALLAGVSCAALAVLGSGGVYAQVDGTWTGAGTEWTDGANWSSNPDVPDNTATFTNNGAPTSVTISDDAEINTMQFTAAAPAYSFTISSAFSIAGIDNSSAFAPSFILNNGAVLSFEIDNGSNATFSGHDLGQRQPRQGRRRYADALGQQQLYRRHPSQRGHTRGGIKHRARHGDT